MALKAAQFTVSKSMVGSNGSFSTAGFSIPAYVFTMTNSIVAGFSANVGTNITQLSNGGITNTYCGGFIFANTSTTQTVNVYLDNLGSFTIASVGPTHSICIDGAKSTLYASALTNTFYTTCTNSTPSCTNYSALCSWAYTDF
jgi:hypothetical protein